MVALLILATTTPSSQTPGFSLKLLPTYSPEPWKNLTLEERHQRIARLSVKHAHGLGSISSVAAINSSNKVKSYQDCPSGDFYVVIVVNLAIGTPISGLFGFGQGQWIYIETGRSNGTVSSTEVWLGSSEGSIKYQLYMKFAMACMLGDNGSDKELIMCWIFGPFFQVFGNSFCMVMSSMDESGPNL
ncbi:hypothetical protein AAG906_026579 [Vitis piasezkii]